MTNTTSYPINNRHNIPTTCFGPPAWTYLHMLTFSYPDHIDQNDPNDIKLKNDTYNFLVYFGLMLPCDICRDHYKEHFNSTNVYNQLNNRQDFILWAYNLHDRVNKTLNKQSISLNELYDRYNNIISDKCNNTCNSEQYYCKVEIINKNKTTNNYETFSNTCNSLIFSDPSNIYIIYIILIFLFFFVTKK